MTELVAYSYAALEAWGFDAGVPRDSNQTPLEFARRLGEQYPEVRPVVGSFTELVTWVAYAPGQAPASSLDVLRDFWTKMRQPAAPSAAAAT
ncbi:MAG: DUF4129 domain-containing protein [Pirellulaceae bacterium]